MMIPRSRCIEVELKLKYTILLLVVVALVGCSTTRRGATRAVERQVTAVLRAERTVGGFERRLEELGAKIEPGTNPGERVATFPARGTPEYFPPRIVRVVYTVKDGGAVVLERVEDITPGPLFAASKTPPR